MGHKVHLLKTRCHHILLNHFAEKSRCRVYSECLCFKRVTMLQLAINTTVALIYQEIFFITIKCFPWHLYFARQKLAYRFSASITKKQIHDLCKCLRDLGNWNCHCCTYLADYRWWVGNLLMEMHMGNSMHKNKLDDTSHLWQICISKMHTCLVMLVK